MINSAAAFFSMGISINDLISKYSDTEKNGKIKILLVPGHEPSFGGAEYKDLLERDLNLALSEKIKNILSINNKFEIITSRNTNGWNPELEKYVNNNKNEILVWINNMKSSMSKLVNNGKINVVNAEMGHSIAPLNSAIFLYGINKWAGENKIDIAIHLHFNDNPKYKGKPNYEGFSIYVPEKQYSNGTSSKILAKDLFDEISKIQKVSTMPEENVGIIEDQELIALGRYNTSDSLSVIIEYAYIYENFMQNKKLRNDFIEKSASSTANAINKFFESRI
jgi:N-acetylmuramoyl-L-alanine amidase